MTPALLIFGFFLAITGVLLFSIWAETWLAVDGPSIEEFQTDNRRL